MNEGTKTGVFWGVAVVMLGFAALLSWPVAENTSVDNEIGEPMFVDFKDPLVASSLKVVTFDELQGQLDTFEVRKDKESGIWTIPSRNGYPADAVEHMRDAANSLVGLKILDIQTENAEDHDDLGVVEPKLEELQVGDDGVGRLVTFKDESQKTLAAIIIGKPVDGEPGKLYVRKPGQDPVYVVKLDESPLATRFQDWIEDDLLKLSSIDIEEMEIKDYNAAVGAGMQVSLTRNYAAKVKMDGSQWTLGELLEYDSKNPLAEPKPVTVADTTKVNTTKLNEMKDALDDLKIVNVIRKPDGMSASLRANKDLLSDDEAVRSLIQRGFIPASGGTQDEIEILSANGELTVGLKDGIEYLLRFGNASGLSEEDEAAKKEEGSEEESSVGGVNRYLLVTARVNDSHFPPPDLQPVPQTLEEFEAMQAKATAPEPPAEAENVAADEPAVTEPPAEEMKVEAKPAEEPATEKPKADDSKPEPAATEKPAETTEEPKKSDVTEPAAEKATEPEPASTDPTSTEPATLEPESVEPASGDDAQSSVDNGVMLVAAQTDEPSLEAPKQAEPAEKAAAADEAAAEAIPATAEAQPAASPAKPEMEPAKEELSEDEKLERLEAEQEKITKENQRKMDERKDKIEAAERRVRDLNARFADWYYVIAEDTYRKLRISRDQLFEQDEAQNAVDGAPPSMPPFGIPGFPGQQ